MESNEVISRSIQLAEELQTKIEQNISQQEQDFHRKMKQLLEDPANKVLLIELLDRSFRSNNHSVRFEAISHTLNKYGIADFFTAFEKFLLACFLNLGGMLPGISVPFFVKNIRRDTAAMVLDSDPAFLSAHNAKRQAENITINVNLIGEEVLGEAESLTRLKHYAEAIKSSYITYISIKITTIFSQINILDFEYSKKEIVKRLDSLYSLAKVEQDKQKKPKFINLDMEEFRDLELTVAAFMESISKFDIEAGIVLQAYLPDSFAYLKKLLDFSRKRVIEGKKPIKVRIVKGANMEAEETIASQKDWTLPTFKKKVDTDSNYKKMLHLILENDNYKYIRIGIASHNLFEIAYAYTLIQDKGATDSFTFEMLEGMSMQASQELSKMHKLILYAPVCDMAHFNNAIAYLVRRLDENTAEQNFMKHFFGLKLNDASWNTQKELFLHSIKGIPEIDNRTKRTQNRNKPQTGTSTLQANFVNEADTDFILRANREWAERTRQIYENLPMREIYAQSIGELDSKEILEVRDKIKGRLIARIHLASPQGMQDALKLSKNSEFSSFSFDKIHRLLAQTAQNIREKRGDLIGTAALEVGKTYAEIDAEVSEAIDFLEFYPYSLKKLQHQYPHTTFKPKGVGVVIAPWNFPIGISAGSIAAALSGGNTVIYKPSSLSAFSGFMLCECFWRAGIPKDALIYLPSKGSDVSSFLINQPEVAFSILTGGEETAYKMLEANPTLFLSAETGGKNATIVTKHADRDQAIKNVIHSAFSNSGQKCSATSLLILEKEVYEDENFKQTLKDAAQSLNMGNPFDFKNKLGTLAQKPDEKVKQAIEHKEPHEEWVLPPRFEGQNEYLMYPAIKYGTKQGDYTYKTELFTPILSVMKARDLHHAIELANETGYGLTGALESLDEREWEIYKEKIEVGNAYINKPSTGAIVLRQPFGGIKKSAVGLGRKVGVFNYVPQFMDIQQQFPDSLQQDCPIAKKIEESFKFHSESTQQAVFKAKNYAYHYHHEFNKTHEFVKVRGEDNLFKYTPIKNILFRVTEMDTLEDILAVIATAHVTKIPLTISIDQQLSGSYEDALKPFMKDCRIITESLEDCISKIPQFERVRYHENPSVTDPFYIAAAQAAKIVIRHKPLLNGRFELLYYFNEKSISVSYHRYGNLGARALKR